MGLNARTFRTPPTSVPHHQMPPEMQACIETCLACLRACEHCGDACIGHDGMEGCVRA
jgi:hypothetical protein